MNLPDVISETEWAKARLTLLAKEKEATWRAMPWPPSAAGAGQQRSASLLTCHDAGPVRMPQHHAPTRRRLSELPGTRFDCVAPSTAGRERP
jgi:hypothetical protein